ncbi:hypothetical protein [Cellulomonas sp. KRMCY2]|uniref:DoxX family protein n=1 Tax=Cellulomonas sp. KRMCY2 TaxID=1304865 RepID=UPI00045EB08D
MHAARSSGPSPTEPTDAVGPAEPTTPDAATSPARTVGRIALGGFLAFTGTAHLTVSRHEFQAQVPSWIPLDPDVVVLGSGVVEIALGAALLATPRRHRWLVGWVVAAFFVGVFPGNVSQYLTGTDGFGLDTDAARAIRLAFQPLLVLWALWSTGGWRAWRDRRRRAPRL